MSDQTSSAGGEPRTPVPGSAREPMPDATPGAALDPQQRIEITVVLRRRAEPPPDAVAGPTLTPAELAERYGADPADIEAVRAALTAAGAEVVSADPATRLVRVGGPTGVLDSFFGANLSTATLADGRTVRHRTGELSVPASLGGMVTGVLGLDDRPQARAQFRVAATGAASVSYTPLQLATIYGLPAGDGTGQTIAIIELGGGYKPADLTTYFTGLGLTAPTVTDVGVDGGANGGGTDPQGADGEVLLDIEVAGAIAPKAALVVYFAPNTDSGFLDAVTQAAHASPAPCAISISWGGSEDTWTAQARTAMDQAFADAAMLGATVTCASGDNGSTDGSTDGAQHVDFPSSSPHALACGGTTLHADPSSGAVTSETVWNDGASGGATGGGVSDTFPVPAWQASVGVPARSGGTGSGRGVPDVAAVADPQTGYQVLIDGTRSVIGGTSAVAPLWAGLVARLAQKAGKGLGLLQPVLYEGVAAGAVPKGFRDVTSGSNGAYSAGPGWDACTGLGVPDGAALADLFGG